MRRTTQFGLLGAALVFAAVTAVVLVARRQRSPPARCPPASVALGARCCAEGQTLQNARCMGAPRRCPAGTEPTVAGCVAQLRVVELAGGTLELDPDDWEAPGGRASRRGRVAPFALDSVEVTLARWQQCVAAGACRPLAVAEPGLPVTRVRPDEAAKFCVFSGGRLPTGNEWVFAAAGAEGRRFPWGQTGLVCRRAAFALVDGPCGRGAAGPELAGLRPDGATPEGLLDLAGNVAEWTVEPDGRHAARGGSYRSRVAAELQTWSVESTEDAAPHVGLRCAYDRAR